MTEENAIEEIHSKDRLFLNQKKIIFLVCISFIIIGIDQLTKSFVHTQLQLHESKIIFDNFFHLTYVRNFGAAFGFLSQTPAVFREFFFLSMPPIACILIIYILATIKENQTAQVFALSSIFGGALGNYIDRLHYKYVIDFIDLRFHAHVWPAFNIADMAIVAGVGLLIFHMIMDKNASAN
jgi:signal peptidase II